MKYEDFLVSSLGKGNVVSPLKHDQRRMIIRFINLLMTMKEFYMMSLLTISKNAVKQEKFLSHLKKQGPGKISILNLPKRKLRL